MIILTLILLVLNYGGKLPQYFKFNIRANVIKS